MGRWAKDPPKKQKPRNGKLKEEAIVFWKDSDAQTILDAIDNQDVKTLMQLKEEGKLIFTQKEYKITYIKSLISADIMVITFKNGQYDHMEGYAFRKKIW